MFTQTKSASTKASGQTGGLRKLYSVHVLPAGHDFAGVIQAGKVNYQLVFAPKTAKVANGKPVLTGSVTIKSATGKKQTAENIEAVLLATQGSITPAPPMPRDLQPSLKSDSTPPNDRPILTDATGPQGSVGVMYFKLSGLVGKALGIPMDLSDLQLNARLFPTSETEYDLQWLYSALVMATLNNPPDEKAATGYLAELNRILKA